MGMVREWKEVYINKCSECGVVFVVYSVAKPEQELWQQVADYCYNCGAEIPRFREVKD